jgi:AAHS family 4-hydroxybenzoate transporter-like MFS transporter
MQTFDVAAFIEGRRLSGFNYGVIALSWLITAFDGLDSLMLGFTVPYMRDQLALDVAMIGYLGAASNAGMAVGSFIAPLLADKIGRRPAVLATSVTFGVLTAATGWAGSYEALLTMRFLTGLAIGGLLPLAWALNIEFVPKGMRATVVTTIMVGYSVGGAMAGPLTNALGPSYGWQGVYVAGGIGTLLCTAALFVWLPESLRFLVLAGGREAAVARTLRRLDPASGATARDQFVLTDEAQVARKVKINELFAGPLKIVTPLLWLGFFMSSLAVFFTSSWGPLVLEDLHFPRDTAAVVKSLASLLGAGAGLLVMRFTDRVGPASIAVYPAIAVPVLLVVGFAIPSGNAFLALALLGTLLVTGAHFGTQSIAGIYYPSVMRATGAGVAAGVGKCGAILGPLVGAAVLSSDIPVVRTYALLAICPAVLFFCLVGIGAAVRARRAAAEGTALASSVART